MFNKTLILIALTNLLKLKPITVNSKLWTIYTHLTNDNCSKWTRPHVVLKPLSGAAQTTKDSHSLLNGSNKIYIPP